MKEKVNKLSTSCILINQNEVNNNQLKKAAFRLPRKQGCEVNFTQEDEVVLVYLAL